MLVNVGAVGSARAPRRTVFAYDISSPRRARHVRELLNTLRVHAQYSVFETSLTQSQFKGVLAELHSHCDLKEDRLAVWWPRHGACVELAGTAAGVECRVRCPGGMAAANSASKVQALGGAGNTMLCYDITHPKTLPRVARVAASRGLAVQRSVYWLRGSLQCVLGVVDECRALLGESDRVWFYPLREASDLWRLGDSRSSVLPLATHHWAGTP